MCYRKIPMYSMLSSTTPGKLRSSYHNVNRSIAFWSDNYISLPVFGISELNHFNLSAFSLLPRLPTLKEVSYPTSSKANYGRLVYLTRWDSHPLYFTTLHIRTARPLFLPALSLFPGDTPAHEDTKLRVNNMLCKPQIRELKPPHPAGTMFT